MKERIKNNTGIATPQELSLISHLKENREQVVTFPLMIPGFILIHCLFLYMFLVKSGKIAI